MILLVFSLLLKDVLTTVLLYITVKSGRVVFKIYTSSQTNRHKSTHHILYTTPGSKLTSNLSISRSFAPAAAAHGCSIREPPPIH